MSVEDYKSVIASRNKQRLEYTALEILNGFAANFVICDENQEELVERSIKVAKEFIKQIDEESKYGK